MPTEKQANFLSRLASERPIWAQSVDMTPEKIMDLSVQDASYWIGSALAAPSEVQ
jgi:hypothetical protein